MDLLPALPLTVVLVASMTAAVTDLWAFRISNSLTMPLFLSGLLYHACVNGAGGLTQSLFGSVVGFGL